MNLAKPFLIIIILISIYTVFLLFSDVEKTISTLLSINQTFLALGVCLWLLGGFFRVLRWHFFLRSITTQIPFLRSSLYFISGFAFMLSPGRVGEMLRSPFIKKDYDIPISKTAPIVLVERFYDLLAVTLIIGVGLIFTNLDKTVLIIPVGIMIAIMVLIKNKNVIKKIFERLSKIKFLGKLVPDVEDSFEVTYTLLRPKYFGAGLSCSLGVAFLEVTGAYLFILGLSGAINFPDLIVLYHAAGFAAAVSMVPAGIGVFEGGLLGLFVFYKLQYEVALAVTVLVRLVSTGMFTVIGLVALRFVSKE